MNRVKLLAALALIVSVFFPLAVMADSPQYSKATEVTLRGNVLYLAEDPTNGSWSGTYVIMRDGHNEIMVYLGPTSFLAKEGLRLKLNDDVRITGSRTDWKGSEIILAREVSSGGTTVAVRTADGQPRW